jgi:hypothetical protein
MIKEPIMGLWSSVNERPPSRWERLTTREDPIAAARSVTRGSDPIEDANPIPVRKPKKKGKKK